LCRSFNSVSLMADDLECASHAMGANESHSATHTLKVNFGTAAAHFTHSPINVGSTALRALPTVTHVSLRFTSDDNASRGMNSKAATA